MKLIRQDISQQNGKLYFFYVMDSVMPYPDDHIFLFDRDRTPGIYGGWAIGREAEEELRSRAYRIVEWNRRGER